MVPAHILIFIFFKRFGMDEYVIDLLPLGHKFLDLCFDLMDLPERHIRIHIDVDIQPELCADIFREELMHPENTRNRRNQVAKFV